MELSWLESLLYGFVSGLAEILPISAHSHRLILLKVFGTEKAPALMLLLIHLGVLAALYHCCQPYIMKLLRAKKLASIPKKRRKRPLDMVSLMDLSLFKTMLIPVIIAFFFYRKTSLLENSPVFVGIFLLLNGIVLYIPQFLPGSNKDSRMLTRVHGLVMGLGGAAAVLPGVSCMGCTLSIGSVCGVEKHYALNMALLLEMAVTVGLIVMDVVGITAEGFGMVSLGLVLGCLLAAAAAFFATILGVHIIRRMVSTGYTVFAFYCWGLALFAFILNLFV